MIWCTDYESYQPLESIEVSELQALKNEYSSYVWFTQRGRIVWRMVAAALELRTTLRLYSPYAQQMAAAAKEKEKSIHDEHTNEHHEATTPVAAASPSTTNGGDQKDSKHTDSSSSGGEDGVKRISIDSRKGAGLMMKRISVVGNGFINPRLWSESEKVCEKATASLAAFGSALAELKLSDRELKAVRIEAAYQRRVTELLAALETAANSLDDIALTQHLNSASSSQYNMKAQYYSQLARARDAHRSLALLKQDISTMKAQYDAKDYLKASETAKAVVEFAAKIKLESPDITFAKKLRDDIVCVWCSLSSPPLFAHVMSCHVMGLCAALYMLTGESDSCR